MVKVATWSELEDRTPAYALVADVDLVVIRRDADVSVFYGRCLHRGALLSDGHIDGDNLICGVHGWDYRLATGVSEYNNAEALEKFTATIDLDADAVLVDEAEVREFARGHPQPYKRSEYLGLYADVHGTPEESHNHYIQQLAHDGLSVLGHHGPVAAMGVARTELPRWDDLQILTAQLARRPQLEDVDVGTDVVIGPKANKPLRLQIPLFVSDMSFGALSFEAKTALAKGAELAGTGICSGEGGMLPEEQTANSRYLYELASGWFGWSLDKVRLCQAFHFKGGQGAKTGTGGHLPGNKVTKKIAAVRGLEPGRPAISPPRFPEFDEGVDDFVRVAAQVRECTGGIPIGFKISAQHIEDDIDFALAAGADYLIVDGRGGATGAAPLLFRDNISVPTMPALARARRHLDTVDKDVTLVVTGGLRTEADFVKALALGADAVAIANSAIQAIGCLGMRACDTNNCPVGIATQKPHLRERLIVDASAERLKNYLLATTELMKVLTRACGYTHVNELNAGDLTTWNRDIAYLTGVAYGGVVPLTETQ